MRVAVDEPRDRCEPATVDLLDVAVEPGQRVHLPDGLDAAVAREPEGARAPHDGRGEAHLHRVRPVLAADQPPAGLAGEHVPAVDAGAAEIDGDLGVQLALARAAAVDRVAAGQDQVHRRATD